MKNFRKAAFAVVILALLMSVLLTACANPNPGNKTVTLIIGEGESQKVFSNHKTDAEYLIDLLDELKAEGELTYSGSESKYGIYLNQVDGVTASGYGWFAVFCTQADYQDFTEYGITRTEGGTEFVSATLGVSSLPLTDGESYMIVYIP